MRRPTIGRDTVAALAVIAAILLLAAFVTYSGLTQHAKASTRDEAKAMDGSTAGANAVTLDDLLSETPHDEWSAGEWSTTIEDLEREYELGQAYPANGKNAALDANTTYNRGGGMVDIITMDTKTNVMIRHYGQLQPDGTVRWYAAETVLNPDGTPMVMPTH